MVSWSSSSIRENRFKNRDYRSCSFLEGSDKECVICDNDIVVAVTIFGAFIPCYTHYLEGVGIIMKMVSLSVTVPSYNSINFYPLFINIDIFIANNFNAVSFCNFIWVQTILVAVVR